MQILVAEDNPINQKVICSMLRRQGWDVSLAVNGMEACRLFLEQSFDLVLMDVQMPEMDGLEAARRIRAEEAGRGVERTPILALTAHASGRSPHRAPQRSALEVTKLCFIAMTVTTENSFVKT